VTAFAPAHTTDTGVLSPSPSATFSPTNAITAGHGYTVEIGAFDSAITSLTADNGDTLTKVKEQNNVTGGSVASLWACLSSNGGTPTFTVTPAASGTLAYFFTEWNQAIGSTRNTNGGSGGSTSPSSGAAAALNGDLAVGLIMSGGDTWSNYPTASWTDLGSAVPTIENAEYKAVSASENETATATFAGSDQWCAVVAVFAPANAATDLTVANASQAQASGSPALTQVHVLTAANAAQAQTAGSPTLTQVPVLAVASATQAQAAGSPALTQVHHLAAANAYQAQTAGNVTLGSASGLIGNVVNPSAAALHGDVKQRGAVGLRGAVT
jgi:hypothetical protein